MFFTFTVCSVTIFNLLRVHQRVVQLANLAPRLAHDGHRVQLAHLLLVRLFLHHLLLAKHVTV